MNSGILNLGGRGRQRSKGQIRKSEMDAYSVCESIVVEKTGDKKTREKIADLYRCKKLTELREH